MFLMILIQRMISNQLENRKKVNIMSEKRKAVKKVKNGVLFDDGCIRIDNVRASYPHLSKAWAKSDADTPKFGITGLGLKETHEEVKSLCAQEIRKILESKGVKNIGAADKFCRNGDDAGKDEAEGHWLFRASESADRQPTVRDRSAAKITDKAEIEKLIYPGSVVNILIKPWWQDNKHGKKINASLIAVQFVEDGERFGADPVDDEDAFEQYEESDTDGFDNDDDDL
jgi:hypothetical protein